MIGTIIGVAVGIAIGFLIGMLLQRSKTENERSHCAALEQSLQEKEASYNRSLQEKEASYNRSLQEKETSFDRILREKEASYAKALREQAESNEKLIEQQKQNHKDALEMLQGRFDESIAKLRESMQNTTKKMLEDRQQEFEVSSKKSLGDIMDPLKESIKSMKEAVETNTTRHAELGSSMSTSIKMMMEHSDAARRSADQLTNALRNNSRVQGEWGETILTELLESNGLQKGTHFDVQETLRDEKGNILKNDMGKGMKPDVILHLDAERDVVIDSKVSLSSFLDYVNADNDADRDRYLKEHVASLQKHVKELVDKDYSSYLQASKQKMGYVIMFVPSTAALYAATQAAPDLWRKAMEQGVYIADEQTLYAALKIVSITWRQIAQADNHRQVYDLANEMLKRVGMFMEKYMAVGKALNSAQKAYDEGYAKLDTQGQSIPQTCNKLIKLGATPQPRKNVPDKLIGITDDSPELPAEPTE